MPLKGVTGRPEADHQRGRPRWKERRSGATNLLILGVNIDHVATLREVRKVSYPSPGEAAREAVRAGASWIVAHLREDRRHIQDDDIYALRRLVKRFNMEMAPTQEMVRIASKVRPDQVTLVPEKRKELTTEGGLNIWSHRKHLKEVVKRL